MEKPRLLVVEDHPATSRALERFLRISGYDVIVANTISSALAAAQAGQFDLLICDLNLSDGTGWDLLAMLKREGPIRAIAFSGYDDEQKIAHSRAAGFLEHVVKTGTDPDVLVEVIERALKVSLEPIPACTVQAPARTVVGALESSRGATVANSTVGAL